MYFEEWTGASVGVGDEGSGVGESEEFVDGEGEFWLSLAQYVILHDATPFPLKSSQAVPRIVRRVR